MRKLLIIITAILLFSTVAMALGRPQDCFDTAYQAHPGYNENQATWDRYTAETDGVCQSTYGTGVPGECEHIVQLSRAGNPYYLCWYNNVERDTTSAESYVYNGKEYYVVKSTDPSKDTGNEVCEALGKMCIGYTEPTSEVCEHFHPSAATTLSIGGDISGVYCDGSPQIGVCESRKDTCHTCPQCTNTMDCSTPIGNLYREMYVECMDKGKSSFIENILNSLRSFFANLFSRFTLFNTNNTIATTRIVTIGPYPDKWACDFYQIPFPGSNKKHVSCPYETPGAAVNNNHHEFCRIVMNSDFARAEICDENGVIVCSHPCETTPAHIIPNRCAFDSDRQRGNQAPPLKWCQPKDPIIVPSGAGRPDNCDDTAYFAHPGYNENKETWDRYTAETDGVCQSQYGRGTPGPCVHSVQLSRAGNPYYLCWYNN